MSFLQLLDGVTAPNGLPLATAATATITTVTVAELIDGEGFGLSDARGNTCVFVFDLDGSYTNRGVGGPREVIDLTGATSADDVRDAIVTAVNASAYVQITAASGGAATVSLTQDQVGPVGNTGVSDTVADTDFVVTPFTGGALSGLSLGALRFGRGATNEGDATLMLVGDADGGDLAVTARLWVFSWLTQRWAPLLVNGGNSIEEADTGGIAHTEVIPGVSAHDMVYLEIEALDGDGTTISAVLASRR